MSDHLVKLARNIMKSKSVDLATVNLFAVITTVLIAVLMFTACGEKSGSGISKTAHTYQKT